MKRIKCIFTLIVPKSVPCSPCHTTPQEFNISRFSTSQSWSACFYSDPTEIVRDIPHGSTLLVGGKRRNLMLMPHPYMYPLHVASIHVFLHKDAVLLYLISCLYG